MDPIKEFRQIIALLISNVNIKVLAKIFAKPRRENESTITIPLGNMAAPNKAAPCGTGSGIREKEGNVSKNNFVFGTQVFPN